jgi:hypothetical protein
MAAGWGAVLRGEAIDLEDWRYVLGNGLDPCTEVHGEDTILRSESLNALNTASEVRARALDMVEYLNGTLALSQGTKPVAYGGAVEFGEDGRLHRMLYVEASVTYTLRGAKARAHAVTLDNDGNPIPSVPQMSEVQRWAGIAENDDLFHEALMYFGKEPTWFNIYKAIECLELRFGGGEAEFGRLGWALASDIKLMKRSANVLRHAKRKFDPPEKPMTLTEATSLLGSLLRRGLEEVRDMTSV